MPEDAGAGAQLATATLVVTTGAGQLVVVYPLPDVGPDAAQVAVGAFVVLLVLQVVVVKLFADVGPDAAQLATATLVVTAEPQIVAV